MQSLRGEGTKIGVKKGKMFLMEDGHLKQTEGIFKVRWNEKQKSKNIGWQ